MEMMGYNTAKWEGLCFNRARKSPLHPCVPDGKGFDYYSKTIHGLGYVSSKQEIDVVHENSSEITSFRSSSPSSYDSELGLNDLFKHLSMDMTSISAEMNDEECAKNSLLWAQKIDAYGR